MGNPLLQTSIKVSVVSSTNCKGLLTKQVIKEIMGFSLSSSSPPTISLAMFTTLSSCFRLVSPDITCLVVLFKEAKNLLTSLLSSVISLSWIFTVRM